MSDLIRKIRIIYYFIRTRWLSFSNHEELVNWQLARFLEFKKKVLINSPFYEQYLNLDLDEWPVINKKIHMENFNLINTQFIDRDKALDIAIKSENDRDFSPRYDGLTVGLSSGTSGNIGLFVASDKEQAEWAGTILAKMLPNKLSKQRIAFFLRANNNLYETVNGTLIKFKFYDLINPIMNSLLSLEKYQPTILVAPAQVLKELANHKKNGLHIYPLKIISVAEVLEPEDKVYIESVFNVQVEQVYQCTEGFLAYTCHKGNLHLNEDIAIIEKEWIDKKSGRFVPIITDFRRHTQPIVRYRLDDILIESKESCDCGSQFTVLASIEGRCDDVLKFYGEVDKIVNVFPDFIRNTIISSSKDISEYKVKQLSREYVEVYLTPFNDVLCGQVESSLNDLFLKFRIKSPKIIFKPYIINSFINKKRRVQGF